MKFVDVVFLLGAGCRSYSELTFISGFPVVMGPEYFLASFCHIDRRFLFHFLSFCSHVFGIPSPLSLCVKGTVWLVEIGLKMVRLDRPSFCQFAYAKQI
jgi:hypothetical protein